MCSVSSSGYLILDKPLDRESLDYYTLVVTASDGHLHGVRNRTEPHTYKLDAFNWVVAHPQWLPWGENIKLKGHNSCIIIIAISSIYKKLILHFSCPKLNMQWRNGWVKKKMFLVLLCCSISLFIDILENTSQHESMRLTNYFDAKHNWTVSTNFNFSFGWQIEKKHFGLLSPVLLAMFTPKKGILRC